MQMLKVFLASLIAEYTNVLFHMIHDAIYRDDGVGAPGLAATGSCTSFFYS